MEISLHLFYIHGLFHTTNLDFYCRNAVAHWPENLIGDCFCCREPDDQIVMVVPAALLAPNRSLSLRSNNIGLNVFSQYHAGQEGDGGSTRLCQILQQGLQHYFSETVGVCRT